MFAFSNSKLARSLGSCAALSFALLSVVGCSGSSASTDDTADQESAYRHSQGLSSLGCNVKGSGPHLNVFATDAPADRVAWMKLEGVQVSVKEHEASLLEMSSVFGDLGTIEYRSQTDATSLVIAKDPSGTTNPWGQPQFDGTLAMTVEGKLQSFDMNCVGTFPTRKLPAL